MAYTRIHGIKSTLNRAIDYIEDPEKTEGQVLISGYNVDPYTAALEFRMTAILGREMKGDYTNTGESENLAYHMIQSFSPNDTITPEEAHMIGKRWADEILEGKYEYVVSTHVDKGHIHNHIIFNAVSFYDYKKFNNYKIAKKLREVSDRICMDHGLSVISNPQFKNRISHYEWEQIKNGTSWKLQIKNSIDEAVKKSRTYQEFKEELMKEGVEVLEGKHITFHKIGVKSLNGRAAKVRGKTIGDDYTREKILQRLSGDRTVPIGLEAQFARNYNNQRSRAELRNLEVALQLIRQENISDVGDFDERIRTLKERLQEVKESIKELSEKNKEYQNAAKYLIAFHRYRPIFEDFQKQNFVSRKKFGEKFSGELAEFRFAAEQLERLGIDINADLGKVMNLVKEQDGKVNTLGEQLARIKDRLEKIQKARGIVEHVLNGSSSEYVREKGRATDIEK